MFAYNRIKSENNNENEAEAFRIRAKPEEKR